MPITTSDILNEIKKLISDSEDVKRFLELQMHLYEAESKQDNDQAIEIPTPDWV